MESPNHPYDRRREHEPDTEDAHEKGSGKRGCGMSDKLSSLFLAYTSIQVSVHSAMLILYFWKVRP